MATLASTQFFAADGSAAASGASRPVPANDGAPPHVAHGLERCVYQPSRKSGPMALLASTGMILAAMAGLATLNVVARHKAADHLTVVAMKELDTTPPPPPPKSLDKPVEQPPLAFVPKPRIALPSPGPTQVVMDVPPPPSPPVVSAAKVAAPVAAAAAPAAPSSGPIEGGDLSSQVISAKPPAYPVDARRRKEQGTVKLLVLVGPDGHVSDIQLAGSSGSQTLDRAALGAVKRWRWAPQKKNGAPVAVRGYVTIPFVLTT